MEWPHGWSIPQGAQLVPCISRAQMTRLIRRRFPVRYTRIDIACWATVDAAHDPMSGPATRKILERELGLYGKRDYVRLAGIPVAHLYRLRKSKTYRTRQATFTKTILFSVQTEDIGNKTDRRHG